MSVPVGQVRYMDFRIVNIDGTSGISGRGLGDWAVIHERNTVDVAVESKSLLDHLDGRYTVSYTPNATGHDYIDIFDSLFDLRYIDVEEVVDTSATGRHPIVSATLDHNFGGTDNLQVSAAGPNMKILIFVSTDWVSGLREDENAIGISALDAQGRWVNQIEVAVDTYHIVARDDLVTLVIAPHLSVS